MKKFYVGIKGFITKDNKILLLRKSKAGFWEPPGGRIDNDESTTDALYRELHEEVLNIKEVQAGAIIGVYRLPKDIDGSTSLLLVYYLVHAFIEGEPELSEEHDDYIWADKTQALKLMPDIKEIIEKVFDRICI